MNHWAKHDFPGLRGALFPSFLRSILRSFLGVQDRPGIGFATSGSRFLSFQTAPGAGDLGARGFRPAGRSRKNRATISYVRVGSKIWPALVVCRAAAGRSSHLEPAGYVSWIFKSVPRTVFFVGGKAQRVFSRGEGPNRRI